MSVKALSLVWESSELKGSALMLMLAVADFADDYGYAYPGVARLAFKCRIGHRTVQTVIRQCEEAGELIISHNQGIQTKHGWTNLYQINIKALEEKEARGAKSAPPEDQKPRETRGAEFASGAKFSPQGVPPTAWNPSVEPLGNMQTDRPGENGPQYTDIDADGNEKPIVYDKNNPEFRAIMKTIYGRIFNLQGKERTNWVKALKRMKDDSQFKEWCFYAAEVEGQGKHINYWFSVIFNEHSYSKFCNGEYVPNDELKKLEVERLKEKQNLKKGKIPDSANKVGTRLFREAKVVKI